MSLSMLRRCAVPRNPPVVSAGTPPGLTSAAAASPVFPFLLRRICCFTFSSGPRTRVSSVYSTVWTSRSHVFTQ